ncbi:hypothetical protein N8T08_009768 [Aspergillus melleus]|uniref:Uncharacterized protein n=1 Tax=Aspergillus melleus TaxID=138277 RepID=A0ACC3ASV2_9EURO|nr:hypothetical protein N8T08_009768 [Aspergillus melleus]
MPSRFRLRERLRLGRSHDRRGGSDQESTSHTPEDPGQAETLSVTSHAGPIEPTPSQITHANESPAAIHNDLWYRAYNSVKEDPERLRYIEEYEKLLSTLSGDGLVQTPTPDNGNDPIPPAISLDESRLRLVIEKGLEKIEKSKTLIEKSNKVKDAIAPIREILNIPMKNLDQTALPWAIATSSLDILMKPTKSLTTLYDGVNQVNSRIYWYSKIIDSLLSPDNNTATLEQIRELLDTKALELYQSLLFYQIKSVCFYYRNQFLVLLRTFVDLDNWDGDLSEITGSEKDFRDALEAYKHEQILNEIRTLSVTARGQTETRLDRKCMRHLRGIDPRAEIRDIEDRREISVRELYDWVLDTDGFKSFVDWENQDSPNLLWINGQAGTGKTMLSVGLIQELLARNLPGVHDKEIIYFLIQDTGKELNEGVAVLRALMWLLLVQNPGLVRYLRPSYEESGSALFNDSMAFTSLLPIFNDMIHDDELGQVVLLIDALDECKDAGEDVFRIIRKLIPTDGTTSKIKILVTSRPLLAINEKMKNLSGCSETIIGLDEHSLSGPINMYIDRKRPDLERKTGDTALVDQTIDRLKKNTGRTFLWVSLVINQLISLPEAFWEETLDSIPNQLHDLYEFLLERLKTLDPHRRSDYCKDVLTSVMLACRPLTLGELELLAKLPKGRVEWVVQDCSSFLVVQRETVFLIHQSAQDYLRENRLRLRQGSLEELHHQVFEQSLDGMNGRLERNMYKLPNHGVLTEEVQVPVLNSLDPVRYSCQYWVYHLRRGGLRVSDIDCIYKFFRRKMLHWLEAMSLLQIIPHVMDMIRTLVHMLPDDESDELLQFLLDGRRFVTKFSFVIAQAPLQVYVSALAFTPDASEVKKVFRKEMPRWVSAVEPLENSWGALLLTLDAGIVETVAVSADGSLMATSSRESVMIWNTATGTLLQSFENLWGLSVHFSPCGKILAASKRQGTVRLWDTVKWEERDVLHLPETDTRACCVFSPSGNMLASASKQGTFMWDIKTLSIQWSTTWDIEWADYMDPLVTFSPDGHLIASVCRTKVHLYNAEWGHLEKILEIQADTFHNVEDVAYSPNGRWVALCSGDGVKVFNTTTWIDEWTKPDRSRSIAFSPNNLLIATGMEDGAIEVHHTTTWALMCTLKCADSVQDLVFLPDGRILISATEDGDVSLWDITLGMQQHSQEHISPPHSGSVNAVAFSPTGQHAASSAKDGTLVLWDAGRRSLIHTRKGSGYHTTVSFSPDGEQLLTSSGHVSKVWNLNMEQVTEIPTILSGRAFQV